MSYLFPRKRSQVLISNILKKIYGIIKKLIGYIVSIIKLIFLFFTSHKKFFGKFIGQMIFGLFVGVVSASIVTFQYNIPKLSIDNTKVKISDNKEKVERISYYFGNIGYSPAMKLSFEFFYGKNGDDFSKFIKRKSELSTLGEGDNVEHFYEDLPYYEYNDYSVVILVVSYEDTNKYREIINKFLGFDYKRIDWSVHVPKTSSLTGCPTKIIEKYEKDLLESLERFEKNNQK